FSLWWMSLLAEKSYLKSTGILDCLRLLALRDLLKQYNPRYVELVSADLTLSEAMRLLCVSLNIGFSWNPKVLNNRSWNIRSILKKLPPVIKAPIFLVRHIIRRWPLRRVKAKDWFSDENSIFFFSYFIHLDREACISGRFYSHQWEDLPKLLHKFGKHTNWVHHFLFSPTVPDTATGIRWLKSFNMDAQNQGFHQFLDSFLNIKIVLKTLQKWFKHVCQMSWINQRLQESINNHPIGWLWPLLKQDWKSSVYGTVAIENLIWMGLINRALASIPRQRLGLYLCENQGWERAFIHLWKKHGHGQLIAVPHSLIRYWDLRYFDNQEIWHSKDALAQPLPNKIALNGNA
ncbi:uncharacterized protein METZ01_LOCUS263836, partial [marine metagenome]